LRLSSDLGPRRGLTPALFERMPTPNLVFWGLHTHYGLVLLNSEFNSSSNTPARRDSAGALRRLQRAIVAKLDAKGSMAQFEHVERDIHARFVEAEREVLGEALERMDIDVSRLVIDGAAHHRVLSGTETYTSAVGPVTVARTLYCEGRQAAVVPLELRAGLIDGHGTPLAARQGAYLVAHLTPQASENTLRELGNMIPSKSRLDRLPKRLSTRWEAQREAFEAQLCATCEVPREAVSLNRVMVPMKELGPHKKTAKPARTKALGTSTPRVAGYREASCATLSLFDAQGERLATVRHAACEQGEPQAHPQSRRRSVAQRAPAAMLGEARRRGAGQLDLSGRSAPPGR
jgi:hypothetical protein